VSTTERLAAALADRYRIERELGAGGMATVYLAHDLKHDRDVAIKVLHPDLGAALGAERFLSEIKTTAKLQHPHILPLLDSGEADGLLYYVMPVVSGETLRAYLDRVHQLPIPEAVRITREVASALDYAHRQQVIHRDIKPENILLHDGSALVADFGIALAVQTAGGQRMTQTGLSLGTPQYMSPEQAMGEKSIDARSDVYALGAVAYEMLTGDAPFTGATVQAVVAKVLSAEPERPTLVRKTIPPHVEDAVLTALAKLPADRFATAAEFGAALDDTRYALPGTRGRAADVRKRSSVGARGRTALAALGVVTAASLAIAAWGWLRPLPTGPVIRYPLQLPDIVTEVAENPLPVLAQDGSFLIFRGPQLGLATSAQLWIKRREARLPTPIAGTTDCLQFTVSPDGQWLALIVGSRILKVPVAGGSPVPIGPLDASGAYPLAWLEDGTIVYSRIGFGISLGIVSSNGGEGKRLYGDDTVRTRVVAAIHGQTAVLFARGRSNFNSELWAVDTRSRQGKLLVKNARWARYHESGFLLYAQENRFLAQRFDPKSLTVHGDPLVLADTLIPSESPFELSRSGTLLLRAEGGLVADPFEMVWVDRAGRITPVDTAWHFTPSLWASDHGWSLSPDGKRVAIGLYTDAGDDIWVKQLPSGPLSRLSFDPAPDIRPHWNREGSAVTYLSTRAKGGVYLRRADGLGADSLIASGTIDEAMLSPDGSWLGIRAGSNGSVAGGRDIYGLRMGGSDTTRVPLVKTPYDEEAIEFSPDGRWLAYQSDETGKTEIFIRAFPNTSAAKYQVSNGGGAAPLWSRDGRELFFVNSAREMVAVRFTGGSAPTIGSTTVLFKIPDELLRLEYKFYTPWDVAPDGRFLMVRTRRTASSGGRTVVIVENWTQELQARMKK
jgi:hypothetical protein